jgi:hypothetical protein
MKFLKQFKFKDLGISLLTPVAGFTAAVVGGSLAAATTTPLLATYAAMAASATLANMLIREYLVQEGENKNHRKEFLAHMTTTAAVVVGGAYMGLALPALLAVGACQTALWYGNDVVKSSKYNWTLAATLPVTMFISTVLTATWASAFTLTTAVNYLQFYLMFVGATFLAKQFSKNEKSDNKIVNGTLNVLPTVLVSALGLFAGVNPYALGLSAVFNLLAIAGENGAFKKDSALNAQEETGSNPEKSEDLVAAQKELNEYKGSLVNSEDPTEEQQEKINRLQGAIDALSK